MSLIGLNEGRPSCSRRLQLSKRTSSTFLHFLHIFLLWWAIFALLWIRIRISHANLDPDSADQNQCGSMRQIINTGLY